MSSAGLPFILIVLAITSSGGVAMAVEDSGGPSPSAFAPPASSENATAAAFPRRALTVESPNGDADRRELNAANVHLKVPEYAEHAKQKRCGNYKRPYDRVYLEDIKSLDQCAAQCLEQAGSVNCDFFAYDSTNDNCAFNTDVGGCKDQIEIWTQTGDWITYKVMQATKNPTKRPTSSPTKYPTRKPTKSPTPSPTKYPSKFPTNSPTYQPTATPTASPTTPAPTFPACGHSSSIGKFCTNGNKCCVVKGEHQCACKMDNAESADDSDENKSLGKIDPSETGKGSGSRSGSAEAQEPAIIAGGIIGGVLFVGCAVGAVLFFKKKQQANTSPQSGPAGRSKTPPTSAV